MPLFSRALQREDLCQMCVYIFCRLTLITSKTGPAWGGGGEEHHLFGRGHGAEAEAHRGDGAHPQPRQGAGGDGELGVHFHVQGRQGGCGEVVSDTRGGAAR